MTVELSRVCPGLTMAFGATVGLFAGAIMARGTAEQRRLFALPALSLEKIGAWAITEPGAGSDAFGAMKTVATPDGDNYQISGHKTFITNAPFADHFLVYAKIDRGQPPEERPIGAFILDRGMAGLATSKPMAKMGMHSSPTGEIFLDNVMVGRERLLGGGAKGRGAGRGLGRFFATSEAASFRWRSVSSSVAWRSRCNMRGSGCNSAGR